MNDELLEEPKDKTIHMALTKAGQALHAKINLGNGTIPLEITRIVTGSGYSDNPLELTDVVGYKQTAQITDRQRYDTRSEITILLTNQGNSEAGIAPITEGYELRQIACFAIDPDDGEILYRISQFEKPNFVPPANKMGWVFNPTWNFTTENASDVVVNIDPKGLVTRDYFEKRLKEEIKKHNDDLNAHYKQFKEIQDELDKLKDLVYKLQTGQEDGVLEVNGFAQKASLQLSSGDTKPLVLKTPKGVD